MSDLSQEDLAALEGLNREQRSAVRAKLDGMDASEKFSVLSQVNPNMDEAVRAAMRGDHASAAAKAFEADKAFSAFKGY